MRRHELPVGLLSLLLFVAGVPAQESGAAVGDLVREGRELASRREFQSALDKLNAALARDATNVEALRWRGHCLTALGLYDRAVTDLDQAIRGDKDNAWAFYARGMAYHHLGRMQEAVRDYTRSLQLDPSNAKAYEWRGFNRSRLGDHLGAYMDFTKGLNNAPESAWLHFARGKAASSLGALGQARKDLEASRLLRDKDAEVHAQLGFVYVAIGDDRAALKSFDRAYQIDPKRHDYARLWRYWLRSRAGKLGVDARDELPAKKWTGELAKVLLGERTRAQLLLRLSTYNISPKELPAHRCEAAFYLGLRSLIERRPNRAREHFRDAVVIGDASMPEWHAARRLARRR